MSKSLNKQKGFTLVEAVTAIAILTIGIFSVSQFFPFSLKIIGDSQNTSTATNLALSKIEEIQSTPYDNITLGTFEAKHRLSDSSASYLYIYQRKTEVEYIDNNFITSVNDQGLKKITVTIYWPSPVGGQEKSIVLKSMIAKY